MHRVTRIMRSVLVLAALAAPALTWAASAATPATAPPTTQPDLVGDRMTFLLVRLAGIEESIKQVEAALDKTNVKAKHKDDAAKGAERNKTNMDLKGGGPADWKDFYGKTIHGFHERDTLDAKSSHRGRSKGGGDSPAQSEYRGDAELRIRAKLHKLDRPEQFDYIYRAYADQARKAKEEVAALQGEANALLTRKRELEAEQCSLWARIAANAVISREISEQPLYKYRLTSLSATRGDPRIAALEAIAQFVRVVGAASDKMEDSVRKDQMVAFATFKENIVRAQKDSIGRMAAINSPEVDEKVKGLKDSVKRLSALAENIVESYEAAEKADQSKDTLLRQTSRGLLQRALAEYAQTAVSLDEALGEQASKWYAKPVKDKPAGDVTLDDVSASKANWTTSNKKPLLFAANGDSVWRLAIGANAFRNMCLTESIDRAHSLGIKYFEASAGQRIMPRGQAKARFRPGLKPEVRDQLKQKLQDAGVKIVLCDMKNLGTDDTSMNKVFDFARSMDIEALVVTGMAGDMSKIERLAQGYGVNIGMHNNVKPREYWSPDIMLAALKDTGTRVGACVDTGNWLHSGIKPLEGLKQLEGHISVVYLKDLSSRGNPNSVVPLGAGSVNVRGVLVELKRQGFSGVLVIEWGDGKKNVSDSDLAESIRWFRKTADELGQKHD